MGSKYPCDRGGHNRPSDGGGGGGGGECQKFPYGRWGGGGPHATYPIVQLLFFHKINYHMLEYNCPFEIFITHTK